MTGIRFEVIEETKAAWGVIVWTQLSTKQHRISARMTGKSWVQLVATWSLQIARESYANWVRWLADKKTRDVLFVLYGLSEEKYEQMGERRY